MHDLKDLNVAIAHYWLVTKRGGEKVLESLLKIFPGADIYTLFYEPKLFEPEFKHHEVTTSFLNMPFFRKHHQKIFPLYPTGVRSLKLKQKYDLLISSESGPIKGIANPDHTPHLCYIHSPMRYCWGFTDTYLKDLPPLLRPLVKHQLQRLQKYDLQTRDHPDLYVANSNNVAHRVEKYYGRQAEVCHPPVDDRHFQREFLERRTINKGKRKHYLSLGALTPYKRIDLLVDTFRHLDQKLIIVGEGSEKKALQKKATDNIVFKGELQWQDIVPLILESRALIFPGEEDFGLVPLEVMAHGTPVLAYGKGGALETVVSDNHSPESSTGLFFDEQTTDSLKSVIHDFEQLEPRFSETFISRHAEKFRERVFHERFRELVNGLLSQT